jgi:hypothetical protein
MVLVRPSAADLDLRKKALVEQVLPRWAGRCGAACVTAWNDSVGKIVGLTATVAK